IRFKLYVMKTRVYVFLVMFFALSRTLMAQENPVKININTDQFTEFAPAFSGDGKTMIFQSNREGGYKLYQCMLEGGQWSPPVPLKTINSFNGKTDPIGGPSLTADGSTLYFCALSSDGKGDMDIYLSLKKDGKWAKPVNLDALVNTDQYEGFPSISIDGKTLYYMRAKNIDGKPCFKIMVTKKDDAGKWTAPAEVSGPVNISCNKAPFAMADNCSLLFASDREDGKGAFDLYRSTRKENDQWSQPLAYNFINSPGIESFASVIPSGENLYYSDRGDIYSINIPVAFRLGKNLDGTITDAESKKSINAKIIVKNIDTKDTISVINFKTAENKYSVMLMPGKNYEVTVTAPNYADTAFQYKLKDLPDLTQEEKNIMLRPKKKTVVLNIKDSETKKGLGVKIKITNLDTGEEIQVDNTVGRDGKYAINLREGNRYNVEVSSQEGYAFSNTNIQVPGENISRPAEENTATNRVQILKDEDLANVPIAVKALKVGTKLLLHDIFFQFNSFVLEDTSYRELDRVIELMQQNPDINVEIAAHSDDVGSDDFNIKLSGKRAQNIADYLVKNGVDRARLRPIGYGKKFPVAPNDTEEGRAKNRRVELKVVK
ncbi:MAG TPA: OmpA family protein, partial [Cytophagaceae bacterium]|nr:OmpA family protein [Cytophagaceae bacterium]